VRELERDGCRLLVADPGKDAVLFTNLATAEAAAELLTACVAQARASGGGAQARPSGRPDLLPRHPPHPAAPPTRSDLRRLHPRFRGLEADLRALAWKLFAAGAALTGLGCAIGWVLAGRSLRPLDRIAATAEGIAAGDYERKIDVEDTESEPGRLAVVLNETFGRMNAARERVTRFTADASHELRTPLAVILVRQPGALRQERTSAEYQARARGHPTFRPAHEGDLRCVARARAGRRGPPGGRRCLRPGRPRRWGGGLAGPAGPRP
jgi:signal transduction histidine kinase